MKEALTGTSSPPADLILVHGSQDALEKYHYTRAFCQNNLDGLNFRGAFFTAAGDTGLDYPNICFEVLCEMPRDLHSLIQSRGRGGRQGQPTACHRIINIDDFLYKAIQIQTSQHKTNENDHLDCNEREVVYRTKLTEFLSTSSLVALNLGCWHACLEYFCAKGFGPLLTSQRTTQSTLHVHRSAQLARNLRANSFVPYSSMV